MLLVDPPEMVPFVVPSVSWKTPPGECEGLANEELALRDVDGTYADDEDWLVVGTSVCMLLDDGVGDAL